MYTYQDLVDVGENEQDRINFVWLCIGQHKSTKEFKTAEIAEEYDKQQNTTIVSYQKTIIDITGRVIPDRFSPSYKMCSNFYNRLTTQRVQYSLSNGVKWTGVTVSVPEGTPGATRKIVWDNAENGEYHYEWQLSAPTGIEEKLGKDFDTQLQKLCKAGIDGGTSFGFWNYDHMEVFKITEFVPLYDEENGSLRAGIRWVRIADKPLRATLYEEDGYTEYIWNERVENGKRITEGHIYRPKRAYTQKISVSGIDKGTIYNGENYPTFPIVPFFANFHKQSAIVGMRQSIDCYDMIKNQYANDVDNALFYWVLKGAAGFDNEEASAFIYKLKQSRVVNLDTDQEVEPITVNPQVEGRERILDRIEKDIYKDFNALDIDQIKAGAVTATQIKAAYEALDTAANQFEYQIIDFLFRFCKVFGIYDTPTFTRSILVNTSEMIQTTIQAAQFLTEDYVTTKILEFLGDGDKAEYILNQKTADEMSRFIPKNETEEAEESEVEENV